MVPERFALDFLRHDKGDLDLAISESTEVDMGDEIFDDIIESNRLNGEELNMDDRIPDVFVRRRRRRKKRGVLAESRNKKDTVESADSVLDSKFIARTPRDGTSKVQGVRNKERSPIRLVGGSNVRDGGGRTRRDVLEKKMKAVGGTRGLRSAKRSEKDDGVGVVALGKTRRKRRRRANIVKTWRDAAAGRTTRPKRKREPPQSADGMFHNWLCSLCVCDCVCVWV
jgi:hypothetical protein